MEGNNKEEKEAICDKSALIAEIGKEGRRIRQALRDIGYYAYGINFVPCGSKYTPIIKIEARGLYEDDKELFDKEQRELEELISNS